METTNEMRLNDYVSVLMETNTIEYIIANYISIRESYYEQKQSGGNNNV